MAKNRGAPPPTPPEGNDYAKKNRGGEGKKGNDNAEGNSGGSPAKGNQNAATHGAYSSPPNLYGHLEEAERDWVDDLTDGYVELAPFDEDNPLTERVRRYCVMIYQEWSAAHAVETEGPSERNPVGIDRDGNPVIRDDEHHLSRRELSLNTKVRQGLKNLGVLPDPDSQQAAATRSLAQMLSDPDGDSEEPIDVEAEEVETETDSGDESESDAQNE